MKSQPKLMYYFLQAHVFSLYIYTICKENTWF